MIGPDLEQFAEELSAYLDDELPPEQRQIVETKLRESAQARRLLDELRATSRIVGALPRHPAPPTVVDDLNAQLERTQLLAGFDEAETAVVAERPGWFPRLSMAAMIAVVAIGGWWMMTGPASSPTTPDQRRLALSNRPTTRYDVNDSNASFSRAATKSSGTREQNKRSLKSADVEAKLAAGVPLKVLRNHAFANEPIHLEIPVRYESEQAGLLARLSRKLASANAIDLAADSADHSPAGAFYYRGRSGVNYKKGSSRQILVRATRKQVEQVLQELQAARNGSNVRLRAGAMTLRGSRKAREALALLASPDGDRENVALGRTKDEKQLLDDILVSLGVDPKTFYQTDNRRRAGNPPGTAAAMADRLKKESPDATGSLHQKTALAKRSKRSAPASTGARRSLEVRGDTVANTGMSVTSKTSAKKRVKSDETYVTFVIEIPITKPVKKHGAPKPTGTQNRAH